MAHIARSSQRTHYTTYDQVCVDLYTFSPGQLYVALSRVRSIEGLHLNSRIVKKDLIVDPVVKDFYENLEYIVSHGKGRKMGRPPISITGELRNKLIWVPKPLEKHVKTEIAQGRHRPIKNVKKGGTLSERVHVRVPEALYDHIKDEIKTWKQQVKEAK